MSKTTNVIRGKPVRTTVQDKAAPCPRDHVNQVFHAPAPNRLWLSDFTYVSTRSGFVYVAFVIDADARRIVGWRVSRTTHVSFVLKCLIPAFDGASFSHESKEAPWARFFTGAPRRLRRSVERYSIVKRALAVC